jgi:hypothetical protein
MQLGRIGRLPYGHIADRSWYPPDVDDRSLFEQLTSSGSLLLEQRFSLRVRQPGRNLNRDIEQKLHTYSLDLSSDSAFDSAMNARRLTTVDRYVHAVDEAGVPGDEKRNHIRYFVWTSHSTNRNAPQRRSQQIRVL